MPEKRKSLSAAVHHTFASAVRAAWMAVFVVVLCPPVGAGLLAFIDSARACGANAAAGVELIEGADGVAVVD